MIFYIGGLLAILAALTILLWPRDGSTCYEVKQLAKTGEHTFLYQRHIVSCPRE